MQFGARGGLVRAQENGDKLRVVEQSIELIVGHPEAGEVVEDSVL